MKVESIKRPWQKDSYQGRSNPDPFYHSALWKRTKQAFKLGTTRLKDGRNVPNSLCIECYQAGIIKAGHTVDHITRIKDGGSRTEFSNLQMLCEHHHAVKSANEGNQS